MRTVATFALALLSACSLDPSALPPPGSGPDAAVDSATGDSSADTSVDSTVPPPTDTSPTDSTPVDDGGGCTTLAATCSDGVLTRCEPGVGVMMTPCNALGCAMDGTRCATLIPSNVGSAFVVPSADDVTIFADVTFDTTACADGPFPTATSATQMGGGEVCVARVGSFTVETGVRLSAEGSRPLVIVAAGAIVIDGIIDVSAYGRVPGPGGGDESIANGRPASGPHPGGDGATSGTWDDGGGGGGGLCGGGGDGGTGDDAMGGTRGGVVAPEWELAPLRGGSGGGSGGRDSGHGGAGGGTLQLTSLVSIDLRGEILAGGGGGQGGQWGGRYGGGGGGGSGGAVLLEAPIIAIGGAGINTAGGGGGGSADGGTTDGESGQNGADEYAGGARGSRAGRTWGSHGGKGGGLDSPDAMNGNSHSGNDSNGGGGGGGAGCILFRTADGVMPTGGRVSPSVGNGLRAFEALRD